MNLWMDKYPDLSIDIDSKALTPDGAEKPLLERVESAVAKFDIDVLRKGEISFAGMKGQEWISTTVSDRHVRLLGFRAESMRPDPSFIRPRITIDLSAGGQLSQGRKAGEYVDSSLTPREAMGLWDAIISSIRLRPDAVRNK